MEFKGFTETTDQDYDNLNVSRLEEKFNLIPILRDAQFDIFEGKYYLEPVWKGIRGAYGGEPIAQGLAAILETVTDDYYPHSYHCYFLKPASTESPIRWQVEKLSNGRTFSTRIAKGYQKHNNNLIFLINASLTKNNDIKQNQLAYAKLQKQKPDKIDKIPVPYEFASAPNDLFYKYKDILDTMKPILHTNGNIYQILPPDFENPSSMKAMSHPRIGNRSLGVFVKAVDDLTKSTNIAKSKSIDFAYILDAMYLSFLPVAMGIPLNIKTFSFFRVSLDHSVWVHDSNFDPTQWLFFDFVFSRLLNNRVIIHGLVFTLDERLVASFSQEALVYIPKQVANDANDGKYKL